MVVNAPGRPFTCRVVHVTAPAQVGGLERVVASLIRLQVDAGFDVHLLTVLDPGVSTSPLGVEAAAGGAAVHVLNPTPRAYRAEISSIRDFIRSIEPHVAHCHGYRSDVIGGAAARAAGVPVVSTVHGFTRGRLKNRIYESMQKLTLARFNAVVAVSRKQMGELRRWGVRGKRLHHVPNAWTGAELTPRDLARAALHVPDDAFHIGWVGRLSREKGPDLFLDAIAALQDRNLFVSVIGDGPLKQELTEQANELGIADRVRFHGALPNASRLFASFDLFALTSRTEGVPIVLFEAMAARVPVVAARVGGIPDTLDATEAILIPSGHVKGFASAFSLVRHDRDAAASRAAAAAIRLESSFGGAAWLEKYSSIYLSILNARSTEHA